MSGGCTVCNHHQVVAIDAMASGSASQASVARLFGLSTHAMSRHIKAGHGGAPTPKASGDATATLDAQSAEAELRAILKTLKRMDSGNLTEMQRINVQKEIRLAAEALSRVAIPDIHQRSVLDDRRWVAWSNAVSNALEPYPDARQDVLIALGQLDLGEDNNTHTDDDPPSKEDR